VRLRFFSGRADTLYRRPRRCTAERNATSGLVSLPLFDRMLARVPGEEAHDSVTCLA
jgi:hypothetical protein